MIVANEVCFSDRFTACSLINPQNNAFKAMQEDISFTDSFLNVKQTIDLISTITNRIYHWFSKGKKTSKSSY